MSDELPIPPLAYHRSPLAESICAKLTHEEGHFLDDLFGEHAREAVRAAVERERAELAELTELVSDLTSTGQELLAENMALKAQAKAEPVAWLTPGGDVTRSETYALQQSFNDRINFPVPLYAHPPTSEWNEAIAAAAAEADEYPSRDPAEDGSGYWAAEEIATRIRALKREPR